MLDAVLFKQPQYAIRIGGASHIDGVIGQFIHGGEIACEPMVVGKIKIIASWLGERSYMVLTQSRAPHNCPWHHFLSQE